MQREGELERAWESLIIVSLDPNIEDGYKNLPIHYASEALTVEDFKTSVELLKERFAKTHALVKSFLYYTL